MGLTKEPSLSMTTSTISVTGCGNSSDSSQGGGSQLKCKLYRTGLRLSQGELETPDRDRQRDSSRASSTNTMDYNWLGDHDPITYDANLAEIDFDDFKNEDIQNAYAFSLQSYEDVSSSGTDMSICRSEALFSSYKDTPGASESVIQDSLIGEEFNFSQGLGMVNKNNYTLTYSGHGSISSHQEHKLEAGGPPGSLTTWSNMVRARGGVTAELEEKGDRGRTRTREENNINNNMDSSRKSRSLPNICKEKPGIKHAWKASDEEEEKFQKEILSDEPNLIKLYLQQRGDRNSWNGTSRGDIYESSEASFTEDTNKDNDLAKIPPMKSKDAVNNFLKTATSKLTSIEENSELSSAGSSSEPTMRPSGSGRQRSVSSRSSMSTTSPSMGSSFSKRTSRASSDLPSLDFLENDVGLWDAFFMHSKNSSKFQSVLKPSLPVDEYLQDHLRRGGGQAEVRDLKSLSVLLPSSQKHLLSRPTRARSEDKPSPIRQSCSSLLASSEKHQQNEHNLAVKGSQGGGQGGGQGEPQIPHSLPKTSVKLRPRTAREADTNLNLINNNKSREEEEEEEKGMKVSKRRSYHPQDFLSKILTSPCDDLTLRHLKKSSGFPKSGSQGNLCDSWADDVTTEGACGGGERRQKLSTSKIRAMPAEYPFQANLGLPQNTINFDLTHKRGLFVSLYSAVERLVMYQDQAGPAHSKAACRCILLHEFCPALHSLLEDGLKEEVITSFGRMKTSVWRLVEAIIQAGPAQRNTCDLVMLLNTKFSSEEDFKKFSGFVIGLLNMSCLHIWFSKLKWSLDVLLRFYERHSLICALHKETKLLFDELIFCLQRLYCIPFHLDMPFNDTILEEITTVEVYKKREHCQNCACTRTPTSGSEVGGCSSWAVSTPTSSASSGRSSRSGKSRIPRPISLPKRLEDKLSIRAGQETPQRAVSAGPARPARPHIKSPVKPQLPPRPKSRVRDTVKLFDAKSNKGLRAGSASRGATQVRMRKPLKPLKPTSPKTGGGEGMVDFDSGGDPFR